MCPRGQHLYIYKLREIACESCGYEHALRSSHHDREEIEKDIRIQIDKLNHKLSPEEINKLVKIKNARE